MKVLDGHLRRGHIGKLLHALLESGHGDLGNVDHLPHGAAVVVRPSGHDQRGAADAGRAAAVGDVVVTHALGDPDGRESHLVGVVEKLELAGEAEDEILDDDRLGAVLHVREGIEQVFVAAAQQEDVGLDDIGQVNQHDLVVVLLPADGVDADGSHGVLAAALDEVAVGGKLVDLEGLLGHMGRNLQLVGKLVHELLGLPETAFAGLARTGAGDSAEGKATGGGANAALVGGEIATVDHGSTGRALAEGDLGNDVALPHDAAAVLAGSVPDVGLVALRILAHAAGRGRYHGGGWGGG